MIVVQIAALGEKNPPTRVVITQLGDSYIIYKYK